MDLSIATMSAEEFRRHFQSCLEIALTAAEDRGFQKGLKAACKAVCEGCRKEWGLVEGASDFHTTPGQADASFAECDAYKIRALIEREEQDDTPASEPEVCRHCKRQGPVVSCHYGGCPLGGDA